MSQARHAVLLMALAALCFTLMGVVIKHLTPEVPLAVIIFFRMAVALAIMLPWLIRNGIAAAATKRPWGHFLRSFCGGTSLLCYIYALAHLPLADAIALSFTSPLMAIPIAVVALGERIGWRRWTATLVGFAGVLVLTRPQLEINPAMLIAVLGALLTAIAQATTRGLTSTEPSDRIIFYFALFGTAAAMGPAAWWWTTPGLTALFWLVMIGVLAAIGLSSVTRALAKADVTQLSPIDFLRLPLGAAMGYALFDERPDFYTVLGAVIIVAATFYITRRGAALNRRIDVPAPP